VLAGPATSVVKIKSQLKVKQDASCRVNYPILIMIKGLLCAGLGALLLRPGHLSSNSAS
jgi:hypothetical protein